MNSTPALTIAWRLGGFAAFIALAACSEAPSEQNEATITAASEFTAQARQPKEFKGWGPFEFGMAFDEALSADPGVRWEGESFRTCRDEMPIRGCILKSSDDAYVPLTAGVALLPHLSFNQKGELITIDMTKRLEGQVTPAQCERAHGQLLDYLDSEWGEGKSREKKAPDMSKRTTPKGRTFFRTKGDGGVFVFDVEEFNELADGRKLTILSHYTEENEYSGADCWLSIYFEGPRSLERPPVEKIPTSSQSQSAPLDDGGEAQE